MHAFIRSHIAKKDAKVAEQVILQYGGSVNDGNAAVICNAGYRWRIGWRCFIKKHRRFATIVKAAAKAKN